MRIRTAVFFQVICTALSVWADEKLPALTVGTNVYSNVTITAITPTDIYFKYDKGVANAKLKDLDPELQKHFHFEPAPTNAVQSGATGISATSEQTITRKNARAIMEDAVARVKAIINQPVRQLPRTPDMEVRTFSPGWFHAGADKPDFKNVDIRTTRDTQHYAQRRYVTSDLNPGVVFVGAELEFNSMTKYFYADRSLPKKKLTEVEMLEINRLYRIIGTCEEKLEPPSQVALGYVATHKHATAAVAASLSILLLFIRFLRGKPE